MIFVVMGAPGAGKGTQCEMIAKKLKGVKLSTGDVLRKHIKGKTSLGLKIQEIMDSGRLVPDDVLLDVLKHEMPAGNSVVLLDGYPRTVEQAEALSRIEGQTVKRVVHIDVPEDILVARLTGRQVCTNCEATYHVSTNPPKKGGVCDRCGFELSVRSDDAPEKVRVRLGVYDNQTKPVLEYYKKLGLYQKVNGAQSLDAVFHEMEKALA